MIHKLASMKSQELRVDMERFNALYSRFYVGDEASKYQLQVDGYSGDAGNHYVVCLNSSQSNHFLHNERPGNI